MCVDVKMGFFFLDILFIGFQNFESKHILNSYLSKNYPIADIAAYNLCPNPKYLKKKRKIKLNKKNVLNKTLIRFKIQLFSVLKPKLSPVQLLQYYTIGYILHFSLLKACAMWLAMLKMYPLGYVQLTNIHLASQS